MSKIIAHRGAHLSGRSPLRENSREAFSAAAQRGAKWLETDVRLLADGSLVLFHDDDLKRIYQREDKISALTASEARALDIVFLDDLLTAELGIGLNLELKLDKNPNEVQMKALAVAVALALKGAAPDIFISSFHWHSLAFFNDAMKGSIPFGLACRRVDERVLAKAKELGAASIHCDVAVSTPRDVEKILAAGFECYIYTINDSKRAEPLWQAGLTGLFTDSLNAFEAYL